MRLIDRITGNLPAPSSRSIGLSDYLNYFTHNGNPYSLTTTYTAGNTEGPPNGFREYADVYKSNGIVFACLLARLALFSEARFAFRRYRDGRPGDLFGTGALGLLERPDRNVTTGGLISRMEQDSSLCGNAYNVRVGELGDSRSRIVRLNPEYVTIMLGTPNSGVDHPSEDPEVQVAGYMYDAKRGDPPSFYPPEEVSHFAPIQDPTANFRGMSWLTPVVREIQADIQATDYKSKFYSNSATPNMVIKFDKEVSYAKFLEFKEAFSEEYAGANNAFKTMFLGAGADATVVGQSFEQMSYATVQKAGENRICVASGVPAVMVGLQSGLDSSTYSNMGTARRIFADKTARPWWRECAASLEHLVGTPSDARLDVDTDDIAFLRDDAKDVAEIQMGQAGAIKQLTEAGFEPDSVVDAVISNDMARLKGSHSGLTSVQLIAPAPNGTNGEKKPAPVAPAT